jgi:hypothetical protein
MKKERKLHNEEIENQGYFEKLVEEFQVNSILPDDGVVEPEGYETSQRTRRKDSCRWRKTRARKLG